MAKIFDGGEDLTCASAAASGMCVMIVSNSPQACTCSCPPDGSGPVCQNNDAGLQRTLNDASFTCTSAAVSGMCPFVAANAPGMCGCSCPEDEHGHRRNNRRLAEVVCTPQAGLASISGSSDDTEEDVVTGIITGGSTDLELMHDGTEQVVGIFFPCSGCFLRMRRGALGSSSNSWTFWVLGCDYLRFETVSSLLS